MGRRRGGSGSIVGSSVVGGMRNRIVLGRAEDEVEGLRLPLVDEGTRGASHDVDGMGEGIDKSREEKEAKSSSSFFFSRREGACLFRRFLKIFSFPSRRREKKKKEEKRTPLLVCLPSFLPVCFFFATTHVAPAGAGCRRYRCRGPGKNRSKVEKQERGREKRSIDAEAIPSETFSHLSSSFFTPPKRPTAPPAPAAVDTERGAERTRSHG